MTFSIYASGPKEQAKASARASSQVQNQAALGEAVCAIIDALPGDRVSISFSGSTYNNEGKEGSSGSMSVTTDTMDKGVPEDKVDG